MKDLINAVKRFLGHPLPFPPEVVVRMRRTGLALTPEGNTCATYVLTVDDAEVMTGQFEMVPEDDDCSPRVLRDTVLTVAVQELAGRCHALGGKGSKPIPFSGAGPSGAPS